MEVPPCGSTTIWKYHHAFALDFFTVFFLMLSSFFVFIFLCTVDMVHCGYPHLVTASLMCSLSFCLSSSSVTSVSHLSNNVRITPIFWCNGCCEEKFRYWSVWVLVCMGIGLFGYWSVWVFFWKMSSFTSPDSFLTSKVSKNGIIPFASSSCVNLMLFVSSTLFRWSVRCCVIPVFITSRMSST